MTDGEVVNSFKLTKAGEFMVRSTAVAKHWPEPRPCYGMGHGISLGRLTFMSQPRHCPRNGPQP